MNDTYEVAPWLTPSQQLDRARIEHQRCKTRWAKSKQDRRRLLLHPLEAHLSPEFGRLHEP